MRTSLSLALTLFTCLSSHLALAHSEHDKARFVAEQGQDTGNCDNALRPCKTISYAVQQANKGDKILIAAGRYAINSSNELFYLKSALVPVLGGYNRFDHFQSQSPNTNVTTLTNVPMDMVDELRAKGFTIIADGKSMHQDQALQQKLVAYQTLSEAQSNQACENGKAGKFDCHNIDLLAHMPLTAFSSSPSSANDIWGHVDLNDGNEYALIGLRNGVAIVNVTDPSSPVEVGTIPGKNSSWRDIKVYQYFDKGLKLWQAYAYATIDNATDYVTIIDLNHLPNSVSLVERNKNVAEAHNVYISNVDHTLNTALPGMTPTLQLIGASKFGGAFHNYSLENPATLAPLGQASVGSGYTHDGASLLIEDDRKTSDCESLNAPCTLFIDFNEKEMKLWNISDANDVKQLGTATYDDVSPSFQYVHSGWGSEDKQYIFLHDEFDEKNAGINSTVRVFSISDLNNPVHIGQWTGSTRAIDHNGFVRGNRYYMSNYEKGLTVLDITDPSSPVEVGSFDTYIPSNNPNYNGAWGTYPFLPSGNILVSDINSGLYILKDITLATTNGSLSFLVSSVDSPQGQDLTLKVQRSATGSPSGNVSVNYEVFPGSAEANQDYTPVSGTLTWLGSDTVEKEISIAISEDYTGEELAESFYVRLYNPTGGATLSSPSYLTVNLEGITDNGAISFTQDEISFAENQQTAEVSVARDGSSQGEISVNYQLESGTALMDQDFHQASGTLTWQDGDNSNKTIAISLIDDNIDESDESFVVTLSSVDGSRLGTNSEITITINDDDSNTAPQITALENFQANTGQTVTLSATVTDNEDDEISYLWQQTSGTSVTLNSANEASANFVAPATATTLEFSLTATDSKGAQTTASVTVSVIAPATTDSSNSTSSGGSTSIYLLLALLGLFSRRLRN